MTPAEQLDQRVRQALAERTMRAIKGAKGRRLTYKKSIEAAA